MHGTSERFPGREACHCQSSAPVCLTRERSRHRKSAHSLSIVGVGAMSVPNAQPLERVHSRPSQIRSSHAHPRLSNSTWPALGLARRRRRRFGEATQLTRGWPQSFGLPGGTFAGHPQSKPPGTGLGPQRHAITAHAITVRPRSPTHRQSHRRFCACQITALSAQPSTQ